MSDTLQHKAVEYDKVKATAKRKINWKNYAWQPKYDGVSCIVRVRRLGRRCYAEAMSRTGHAMPALTVQAEQVLHLILPAEAGDFDYVFFAEAWHPAWDFARINGTSRKQSSLANELQLVLFDRVTGAEFAVGCSSTPYRERLNSILLLPGHDGADFSVWPIESNREGELSLFEAKALGQHWSRMQGCDGIIARDMTAPWRKGPGTDGEILKFKGCLSYTLRVKRIEMGKGKHEGRMGAVVCAFEGLELRVGTGFNDGERELPESFWINRLIDVEALTLSSNGLLREPRYKGVRFDVETPDA